MYYTIPPLITPPLETPPRRTFELWFLVFCVEFIIFYFVCNSICGAVIKVLLLRRHLSPVATAAPKPPYVPCPPEWLPVIVSSSSSLSTGPSQSPRSDPCTVYTRLCECNPIPTVGTLDYMHRMLLGVCHHLARWRFVGDEYYMTTSMAAECQDVQQT